MFGKQKTPHLPHSGLSFDELINKKRNLDLEIAGRQETEVENLKSKVVAVTDALGITIAELFNIKAEPTDRRPKKRRQAVKYRDPDNPEYTWSGKGKTPKWLQEKLDGGATMEQFQVP